MKTVLLVVSFQQWCEQHQDLVRKYQDTTCPECNGTGEIICPCCENDAECRECDGTGQVEEDLDGLMALYKEETGYKAQDVNQAAFWQGDPQ